MVRSAFIVAVVVCASSAAMGAIESRDTLKTYFETGDVPTQQDFVDVIDSIADVTWEYDSQFVHTIRKFTEAGGIVIVLDGTVEQLAPGDVIGPGSNFADSGIIDSALNLADDRYLLGLRFGINETLPDTTLHYGFIDVSVDGPGSPTQGAIHIYGFAYESEPDTPITAFFIPEPASAMLMAGAVPMLLRRRR